MLLRLEDAEIDCVIETGGIRFIEVQQRDEAISQVGIYIRYIDEHEVFIYSPDPEYNKLRKIDDLYKKLWDALCDRHQFADDKS